MCVRLEVLALFCLILLAVYIEVYLVAACLCCAEVSNLYVHYSHLAVLHVCRSIELSREVVVNSIVNLDIVDEETCRKSLCVEVRTDVAVLYACVANASEVERYRTPAN